MRSSYAQGWGVRRATKGTYGEGQNVVGGKKRKARALAPCFFFLFLELHGGYIAPLNLETRQDQRCTD